MKELEHWKDSEAPIVVLSDVHLSANLQPERERALEQLLALHPGLDVVFLGDSFEFSNCRESDAASAVMELARVNGKFVQALHRHTATGASVFFVAGNHDAPLVNAKAQVSLAFGPNAHVVPWCLRYGDVHLEHGHVFDRDNAPLHPLAAYAVAHECLGSSLMRTIVVDRAARVFAHAHDLTPLRALAVARITLGWRLPFVLARLSSSVSLWCLQAAFGRWGAMNAAKRLGLAQLTASASNARLCPNELGALARALPRPTHSSFWRMVWRMYLDVPLALGGAGVACWWSGVDWAIGPSMASLTYLFVVGYGALRGRTVRRYEPPIEALRRGSRIVSGLTRASRVVFGHTHVEYDDGVYFNLGSFGYGGSAGRPYALVEPNGTVARRFVAFD